MIKEVKLINRIFGCFITPNELRTEEVSFDFLSRDEIRINYEEMSRVLMVWSGELFDENDKFICFTNELNCFYDFQLKNKNQFYEQGI